MLAHSMGLGKTLSCLAFLLALDGSEVARKALGTFLVVAPPRGLGPVLKDHQVEAARFLFEQTIESLDMLDAPADAASAAAAEIRCASLAADVAAAVARGAALDAILCAPLAARPAMPCALSAACESIALAAPLFIALPVCFGMNDGMLVRPHEQFQIASFACTPHLDGDLNFWRGVTLRCVSRVFPA